MKPYHEEDGITIYHGDCRAILPLLPKAQALISDPPYGVGYVKGGGGKGKHTRRNLTPVYGDSEPFDPAPFLAFEQVILWGAEHYSHRLPPGRLLVWDKLNGLESFDSFADVECAWHNKAGAARIFRYLWKGICQEGDKQWGRVHPTQKPVPLMIWCIKQASIPNTIVDPFMGGGSTLIAAKNIGVQATGIEIDERYCEIAANRLRQEVFSFENEALLHSPTTLPYV